MSKRIEIKDNYFYLTDTGTSVTEIEISSSDIYYKDYKEPTETIFLFRKEDNQRIGEYDGYHLNDLVGKDGLAFDDYDDLLSFLSKSTGGQSIDSANQLLNYNKAVFEGAITGVSNFNKFGRSKTLATSDPPVDIWNSLSLYTGFPTEVETLEVFSSSVNDTDGGTGARTIEISNLLDADFNQSPNITVTLNGTTAVSLGVLTYSRASRVIVKTAGSINANDGEITLRHTTTIANIFAVVPIGHNQTQIFAYTVPTGKTLYIPNFKVSMTRANGTPGSAHVAVRLKEVSSNVFRSIRDMEITDAQNYEFIGDSYFIAGEKTDIKATIESVSDNGTTFTGEADGWLVDN